MYRIQEDVIDLKKRKAAEGVEEVDDEKFAGRLLDLKKAYPRVNKYEMWKILEKYGMGEKCLRTVKNLHETTEYNIKSREAKSEAWTTERGLREGCPSSPPLFNIFNQVGMRIAANERKREGEVLDLEVGIPFKWVPGSSFPAERLKEKHNSEAKSIRLDKGLFADDTKILGRKKEL